MQFSSGRQFRARGAAQAMPRAAFQGMPRNTQILTRALWWKARVERSTPAEEDAESGAERRSVPGDLTRTPPDHPLTHRPQPRTEVPGCSARMQGAFLACGDSARGGGEGAEEGWGRRL